MKNGKLMLRLSDADAQELKRILLREHGQLVRDLAHRAGCGYTREGIELCRRKSRVGYLMECLDGLHAPRLASEKAVPKLTLRVAA